VRIIDQSRVSPETPELPSALVLCAHDNLADLRCEFAATLRDCDAADLNVRTGGFDATLDSSNLLIQIVRAQDVTTALTQLATLRSECPTCAALIVSVDLDSNQIGHLLRAGACDFILLPAAPAELSLRLRRALGLPEAAPPPDPRPVHPALRGLIGNSPVFMRQVARVPLLARYDASVLILGETGTGKEVCAQAIHYLSARAGGPWVSVNCGAIPTELVEAELFGHVKGAYTDAHSSRKGLVHEAEGGTLFLDEIDSLPYGAQAKLLRFLQDKEYRPVGSNQLIHADVRVIAATNRNPVQLAARGEFRHDLLFRLNVLAMHLPLLRDRLSDIPSLALYFLARAAQQWHKLAPTLSPSALRKLMAYDWPGNVRELKNVMERAVLMSSTGPLTAQDIDLGGALSAQDLPDCEEPFRVAKARLIENFERTYIEHLLVSNDGNVTRAARDAQKNRRAFFELMRKYKIASDSYRGGQYAD
jgi:DNA-binding NtrC family response regulator